MKKAVIFDLDGTLSDTIHSIKYCGDRAVAPFGIGPFTEKQYCYFIGDGAANQGVLHETLNMCALLKLPLLAICENNGVAATTLTTRSTAEQDRCKLAAAYGIAAETVDGNDLEAVCDAAARAVKAIRKTGSPRLLDLRSYRMEPHCGIIKDNRDPEIHHRQVTEFDPLLITARRHPDIFTEKELAKLQSLAESRVERVGEIAIPRRIQSGKCHYQSSGGTDAGSGTFQTEFWSVLK